ncbi:hypothetical protein [Paenibacillus sp. AD87]|nr:hypothetical protein [Paenibacillus sp. AD87]
MTKKVLKPSYFPIEIPGGLYAGFTVEVWNSTPEQLDMKIYIPLK